jgi:hypothetical protein
MKKLTTAILMSVFSLQALALGLSDLTNTEATGGLKDALTQAVTSAVGSLGVADGFFANPKVKISLPASLNKVEKSMRMLGMGKQADDLTLSMNRAAESAVPEAKALLVNSVKKMSVQDVKQILAGGDDAATQYFKKNTSAQLSEKFLPIVKKATQNVQLAQQYNQFAETGVKFGLLKAEQSNLDQYVTQKALDGLFTIMADEERAIRKDPLGASSNLVKKVFGAIISN